MSLYGALYSGVSGLNAQSTKLATIADNISNVNTIGYKAVQGTFETLVTSSVGGTAYSPGGVIGGSRKLISQQGLLQATSSSTDIAISGNGMIVVNQLPDSTGQVFYTRAGSFTQDANGNFKNTAGFFLQAWPLDRDGRLPGEPGNANTLSSANLSSLLTVNVQNLTGAASSTTSISISANLKSSETIYPGSSITGGMDINDTANAGNEAEDIIIPQNVGSTTDDLTRGDVMTITTNTGTSIDFTYGGFTLGRLITSGAGGDHGSAVLGAGGGSTTLGANPIATTNASSDVVITHAAHGLVTGDVVDLSGAATTNGIVAADLTGTFVVTVINANSYSITTAGTATSTGSGGGAAVVEDIRPTDDSGFILDASSATQSFLGTTGTGIFDSSALSFTITTLTTGTSTFTYTASSPNIQAGEFNNLTNLAQAISAVSGLTARVSGGRLYVSAINAEEDIDFANGKAAGTDGATAGTADYGIDWVRELGLSASVTGVANQFSTMQGLADRVDAAAEVSAAINNPLSDSEITISIDDPLGTLQLEDDSANVGSVLAALGFVSSLSGTIVLQDTGALGPAYDPTDATKNMASGSIAAQFSRPMRVFDSLGSGHDINIGFIKTGINTWAAEVYAIDDTEVSSALGNGLLAYGSIFFNGDGSLLSLDSTLINDITVTWTNQAIDSIISVDWGTAGVVGTGDTDGLSQFDSAYKVNFARQNGAPVGELTGVAVDEDGIITVSYSNGETQDLFKIPIGDFSNPDELEAVSGNVYLQTSASGDVNLVEAGSSGVGKIASSSLETSNVELATQLTDMIVAQRAYQANTKVITTADSLLEQLNNVLR